jgi:L-2-hydroxyglutarate oxidase LhgO
MNDRVDCVVIGAGVIGLAIGRELAQAGREVIVLERNTGIGEETSSRNSEVIHAGLYYPPGSLKAQFCVHGKHELYRYCEQKHVPHARCGKLIVATDARQEPRLREIAARAAQNGVHDLSALNAAEIHSREPAVQATAGLWSPSTGIIDSHAFMLALAGDLEAADGLIVTDTNVASIQVTPDGIVLGAGDAAFELHATTVVNAGGLNAGPLAAVTRGTPDYVAPKTFLAKGNYFVYDAASPFQALVYPLPEDGGLGVHATHDLAGKLRFGPDVEWVDRVDYAVDSARRAVFAEAIRSYWPDVDENALTAGYSGIRPKLGGPGSGWSDFRLDVAAQGRARQLIHLLGIESPGLTSALALAAEVRRRVDEAAGRG